MKIFYILLFTISLFSFSQDNCTECPDLYNNKKYVEIISFVKSIGDKASINDLVYLGRSYQSIGDNKNAIKTYEKILLIDDKNIEACVAVSALFIEIENYDNALFAVERALKYDESNVNALYNLGVIYYYKKDLDNFKQHIDKYIENKETKDEFLYLLALTQIDQEKYDEAIKSLTNLEKVNPNYEFLSFYQGYCYFLTKQYEKAKTKFLIEAKKNNDISSDSYYYLARTNVELNNKVDACEAYNNAINLGDLTLSKEADSYCDENKGKKIKFDTRKAKLRL